LTPVPLTERTITDRTDLLDALAGIRRTGYAIDDGEHAVGVTCVAAPVLDREGLPCAALSVSGPTDRIRNFQGDDGIAVLGELLMFSARDASAALGYRG
jgi:IclR family acetate operon transcriptional repressor